MQPIFEFLQTSPTASPTEIVRHFENVLEIPRHVEAINREVELTRKLKREVRPLYAKRMEVQESISMIMSDIEMEIMIEYPPRKGSDAQREAMRRKLQSENPNYVEFKKQYDGFTNDIQDVEEELKYVEMNSKNGRRVTELFQTYVEFVQEKIK